MAYCTAADVTQVSGVKITGDYITVVPGFITQADDDINHRLKRAGIALPITEVTETLKNASAYLTAALVLNYKRDNLSRPNSINLGGEISIGTAPEVEIAWNRNEGYRLLSAYIADVLESSGTIIMTVEGDA